MNYDDKFHQIINQTLQKDKQFTKNINKINKKAYRGRKIGITLTILGLSILTATWLNTSENENPTLWITTATILTLTGILTTWTNGTGELKTKTTKLFNEYCKHLEPPEENEEEDKNEKNPDK